MNDLASLYDDLVTMWRALPLSPFEKGCIQAPVIALGWFLAVYALERACAARTHQYRSRAFFHDIGYWLYYRSGSHILVTAAFFAALERPLSFLDLKVLTPLPFVVQALAYLVIADCISYWIHRAQHHFKFLWAFHTTHHSQEQVNFFTGARFHPVETFIAVCLAYVPSRILGADPVALWFPLVILGIAVPAVLHTQLPWRYGPFYKMFVSPVFHSYHHSVDPVCHNKNFSSAVFSVWDYLFGTAVDDNDPKPTRFGLETIRPTSLWSTLVTPFRLLYEFYFLRGSNKAAGPI